MESHRSNLAQMLADDRRAFERAPTPVDHASQAAKEFASTLRHALGLTVGVNLALTLPHAGESELTAPG